MFGAIYPMGSGHRCDFTRSGYTSFCEARTTAEKEERARLVRSLITRERELRFEGSSGLAVGWDTHKRVHGITTLRALVESLLVGAHGYYPKWRRILEGTEV